jgi:hypothetical protein
MPNRPSRGHAERTTEAVINGVTSLTLVGPLTDERQAR